MLQLIIFLSKIFFSLNNKSIINFDINNKTKNKLFNHSSFKYKENLFKKNVIIGIIRNYRLEIVLPFFRSYLQANFTNCDIVMFVKDVSKTLINYLKNIGVIIYKISEIYNKPVTSYRWKYYINFLKKNKNIYNIVFICDIRDTFFQKDIFKYYDK